MTPQATSSSHSDHGLHMPISVKLSEMIELYIPSGSCHPSSVHSGCLQESFQMSPAGSPWQVVSVSQDVGWIFRVSLECRAAFLHPSSGTVL